MDWYLTIYEIIDLRSFSNLWFWIMLAVFWSTASHFVIGVPFDMVTRAAHHDPHAERDLSDMVRVHSNRLIYIADTSGAWLVGFAFFALTALGLSGFLYGSEFCQAVFLIIAPMCFVFSLSVRTARIAQGHDGADLYRLLRRHRLVVQVVGLFSILITSMWGMYVNLSTGPLGA